MSKVRSLNLTKPCFNYLVLLVSFLFFFVLISSLIPSLLKAQKMNKSKIFSNFDSYYGSRKAGKIFKGHMMKKRPEFNNIYSAYF